VKYILYLFKQDKYGILVKEVILLMLIDNFFL